MLANSTILSQISESIVFLGVKRASPLFGQFQGQESANKLIYHELSQTQSMLAVLSPRSSNNFLNFDDCLVVCVAIDWFLGFSHYINRIVCCLTAACFFLNLFNNDLHHWLYSNGQHRHLANTIIWPTQLPNSIYFPLFVFLFTSFLCFLILHIKPFVWLLRFIVGQ